MSGPRFDHWHVDFDTMTITLVGRCDAPDVTEAGKHRVAVVVMDDKSVWMSTKHGFERVDDGKNSDD